MHPVVGDDGGAGAQELEVSYPQIERHDRSECQEVCGDQRYEIRAPELTTEEFLLEASRARELGCVGVLPKPFDVHDLVAAVEDVTAGVA